MYCDSRQGQIRRKLSFGAQLFVTTYYYFLREVLTKAEQTHCCKHSLSPPNLLLYMCQYTLYTSSLHLSTSISFLSQTNMYIPHPPPHPYIHVSPPLPPPPSLSLTPFQLRILTLIYKPIWPSLHSRASCPLQPQTSHRLAHSLSEPLRNLQPVCHCLCTFL